MGADDSITMLNLFSTLKTNVPLGRTKINPQTEPESNRLHYRATVIILMGCSLLVTCLEWVGNGSKISCVMEGAEDNWVVPKNVINTFCFVMTTFTLPKHLDGTVSKALKNINCKYKTILPKVYM